MFANFGKQKVLLDREEQNSKVKVNEQLFLNYHFIVGCCALNETSEYSIL